MRSGAEIECGSGHEIAPARPWLVLHQTFGGGGCAAQKFGLSLCGLFLQPIFMVQATEDRSRSDKIASGKLVTVRTRRNPGLGRLRNSGSQRAMRPAPIVVADEFSDDPQPAARRTLGVILSA